jgi:hypothetical protein
LVYSKTAGNISLSREEGDSQFGQVVDGVLGLGRFDPSFFDADYIERLHFEELSLSGRQVVRATFGGTHQGNDWQWIVDFEPSLGYRFSRWAMYVGGALLDESTVSDFKDSNGYIVPRHYRRCWYDGDSGVVVREQEILIEDLNLDIEIPDDVFRIDVPGNTLVQCLIPGIPYYEYTTEKAEALDPDRIIFAFANLVGTDQLPKLVAKARVGAPSDALTDSTEASVSPETREHRTVRMPLADGSAVSSLLPALGVTLALAGIAAALYAARRARIRKST